MSKPTINALLVIMSKGKPIQIDGDEVGKVMQAVQTGNMVKVRQGIINPSFIVNIVRDDERTRAFNEEVNSILDHNQRDRAYNDGKYQREVPTARPLKDIFEGVTLNAPNQHQLGDGQA